MEAALILTAVVLIVMTLLLVRERFEADLVMFTALLVLIAGGVVPLSQALSGFANPGMLTIAFLFGVAGAVQNTGLLSRLGPLLLGYRSGWRIVLLRFLPIVSVLSAFINNTPIVSMLIPVISRWSRQHKLPPSRFLIPLSYATILGGMCTLIGTSTNLVVHGLMVEHGLPGFSFFELARVGVPVALTVLAVLILVSPWLLRDRRDPRDQADDESREFVVAMKVEADCAMVGKTIETAGLRHLSGLFLFQVEREDGTVLAAHPETNIFAGDRLFFTGLPGTIIELQRVPGLTLLQNSGFDLHHIDQKNLDVFEVVVSHRSNLIGQNVRQSNFRSLYNGVILAIHRRGERIRSKIGDVVLRPGDTLLVLTEKNFSQRFGEDINFYLVSEPLPLNNGFSGRQLLAFSALAAMVLIMALQLLPTVLTVMLTSALLVLGRCISPQKARMSVDFKVLLMIVSALGLAKGVEASGLAALLADELMHAASSFGSLGLLASVYLLTNVYTELITNNAAAALTLPIALSVSQQAGLPPLPFMVAVALAASAGFATPIGYQTNLMVYGPGGYRFSDYLRIGLPVNITAGIMAVALIWFVYF